MTHVQIGSDINGKTAGDYNGTSVSLSNDGTILAMGAILNNDNGDDAGHVRVYKYNKTWQQIGNTINGENEGEQSGYSISLNGDGTIIAIGAPNNDDNMDVIGRVRVYKYSNDSWLQLGGNIDGKFPNDRTGNSVSLNHDGNIVAIGAPNHNTGCSRVYQFDGSIWSQLGSDINGELTDDESGFSVSLSSDGNRVAIGSPQTNITGKGTVRVYERDITNTSIEPIGWIKLGTDIHGGNLGDGSGYSVSLNEDGTIVAIGSPDNDTGCVRIYQFNGSIWYQLGTDINGETNDSESGISVSLNNDGTRVAIGTLQNQLNSKGTLRVYEYSSGSWSKLGTDINGQVNGDKSGTSVSLNSDGTIVAIGAPENDEIGVDAGHVHVYDILGVHTSANASAAILSTTANSFINSGSQEDLVYLSNEINNIGNLVTLTNNDLSKIKNALTITKIVESYVEIELLSIKPENKSTSVEIDAKIVLNFSKKMYPTTGGVIIIKNTLNNTIIERININSSQVSGSGSKTIIISPRNVFEKITQYSVTISNKSFFDKEQKYYKGLTISFVTSATSKSEEQLSIEKEAIQLKNEAEEYALQLQKTLELEKKKRDKAIISAATVANEAAIAAAEAAAEATAAAAAAATASAAANVLI